jgi:hypothetical protein
MGIIQVTDRLELDENAPFDQDVCGEVANDSSIVPYLNTVLLLEFDPSLPQLDSQGIPVDFLQETAAQLVAHFNGTPDHPLGDDVQLLTSVFICVHLWLIPLLLLP